MKTRNAGKRYVSRLLPSSTTTTDWPGRTVSEGSPSRGPSSSHPYIPLQDPTSVAKIHGHEARASLLGGQLSDSTYEYQPYAGGYHARDGLGTYPAGGGQAITSKMYLPNSLWTWSFVGVTCVQAAIVLAFESYVSPMQGMIDLHITL